MFNRKQVGFGSGGRSGGTIVLRLRKYSTSLIQPRVDKRRFVLAGVDTMEEGTRSSLETQDEPQTPFFRPIMATIQQQGGLRPLQEVYLSTGASSVYFFSHIDQRDLLKSLPSSFPSSTPVKVCKNNKEIATALALLPEFGVPENAAVFVFVGMEGGELERRLVRGLVTANNRRNSVYTMMMAHQSKRQKNKNKMHLLAL